MSDNAQLPATGLKVVADEVTYSGDTALLQVARIAGVTGSEGSKTVVEPSAAEVMIGNVGGKTVVIGANFTRPSDTNAYAAGDAVTNSTSSPSPMTFDGASRFNGGSGVITSAILISSANQSTKGLFDLYLYDTSPAADNDNAAWTPSDGETETFIGRISFNVADVGDAAAGASGNVAYFVHGLSIPFKSGGGNNDIFGLLVTRNAYTPVSAEKFTVRLGIIQD